MPRCTLWTASTGTDHRIAEEEADAGELGLGAAPRCRSTGPTAPTAHGFWYEPTTLAAGFRHTSAATAHPAPSRRADRQRVAGVPERSFSCGPAAGSRCWTSTTAAAAGSDPPTVTASTANGAAATCEDCSVAIRQTGRRRHGRRSTRVFARGASAGGYLTLQCVTATTLFAGGMARCGIADLGLWRDDAHDFESRYTDILVGAPSQARALRRELSGTTSPSGRHRCCWSTGSPTRLSFPNTRA